MTLPGSVWYKPGAGGRPSLMDTVLPPPGALGDSWGQREADGAGCRLGVLTGPKGTPGLSSTTSIKEAHFVFYGGSPCRPAVSVVSVSESLLSTSSLFMFWFSQSFTQ